MFIFSAVFFGLTAVIIGSTIIYNSPVGPKHNTAKAWSNTDVLLKHQQDELPK